LENRRSKDDKIFRGMWEAVETKAGEARIVEAEEERKKRKNREKNKRRKNRERRKKKKGRKNPKRKE